jgi:hypothetical protein
LFFYLTSIVKSIVIIFHEVFEFLDDQCLAQVEAILFIGCATFFAQHFLPGLGTIDKSTRIVVFYKANGFYCLYGKPVVNDFFFG